MRRCHIPTFLSALVQRTRAIAHQVLPGERAFRGAAGGITLASFGLLLLQGALSPTVRNPGPSDLLALSLFLLVGVAIGGIVAASIRLAARVPWSFWWALVSGMIVIALAFGPLAPKTRLIALAWVVAASSLAGGGLAAWRGGTIGIRVVAALSATIGFVALAAGLAWLLGRGAPEKPLADVERGPAPDPIAQGDPSKPGPFPLRHLAYGSGRDLHRPEYGAQTDFRAPSVDGSPYLPTWAGAAGEARTAYWGFDATALPLQGRVFLPDGPGPFPLVLMAHGNHDMTDFSDAGYAYLGNLLASRGFVFVSVDHNFLNSSGSDLLSLEPERAVLLSDTVARAFLLLEHLRLWRGWNAPGGPFAGKVDMDRVALIGHSRGGESVAVAAALNRLSRFPDDARIRFDYGFGIRSVATLASVDGAYRPAAVGTPLQDLNYLTLHGTHDGEVPSFFGARQYERVAFTGGGDWFKAAVYVHRANHAQFNQSWKRDSGALAAFFFNAAALLPRGEQERVAQTFVSAFLEATLNGQADYLPLFQDARAGAAWLPEVVLVQQFEESRTRVLASYEEDIDVLSTTAPGGSIEAEGLTDWSESRVSLKWEPLETRGVLVGWSRSAHARPPTYALRFDSGVAVTPQSVLTFQLADAKRAPRPPLRGEPPREAPAPGGSTDSIDLTLELVDGMGTAARLPLSHQSALRRQIETETMKSGGLTNIPRSEVVFQTFRFPLASFASENPGFESHTLKTIRFVFDRTAMGVVLLDEVGLR